MDKLPIKRVPAKVKVVSNSKTKKEVVLSVKKVPKKSRVEKTGPTKAKTETKANSKIARKLPVKKVSSKAMVNSEEVKLVPGLISLRLAEKRRLYESVYQKYIPKVMRPIAISGGYAYVTIGIFLALFMASPSLTNIVSQSASVLCFTGECEIASTTEATVATTVKPVEFVPLAPIVPGLDTNLQLSLNFDVPVRLTILPISGGSLITIYGVAESASDLVNFLLPTATLSNGTYLIQAELFNEETKQVKQKFIGPTMVVTNAVAEVRLAEEVVEVVKEEAVPESILDEEGEVLGISTSTPLSDTETILETITEEESEKKPILVSIAEDIITSRLHPSPSHAGSSAGRSRRAFARCFPPAPSGACADLALRRCG